MRVAVLNANTPSETVYIQKDFYLGDVRGRKTNTNSNGKKRTTKIVARLGKMSELMAQMNMSRKGQTNDGGRESGERKDLRRLSS